MPDNRQRETLAKKETYNMKKTAEKIKNLVIQFQKKNRMVFMILIGMFLFAIQSNTAEAVETTNLSWDITNDGQSDTVSCEKSGENENNECTGFTVKVNGDEALTINMKDLDRKLYNRYYYNYRIMQVTVAKKHFMYIHLGSDIDHGPSRLYEYRNGKLETVIDFLDMPQCHYVRKLIPKNNRLVVNMENVGGTGLGVMSFRSVYEFKNDSFRLQKRVHKILEYTNMPAGKKTYSGMLTTKKEISLYKDKNGKKKAGSIAAAQKVKAKKLYETKDYFAVYLEGKDIKGWYTSKDLGRSIDPLFVETADLD